MENPLLGTVLKLNRAEEHLHSIKDAINEFIQSDFYETVAERDYKGRLVARTKRVQYPSPELSVLIGDCVHNYRSALDQLAYALAAGHTNPLPKRLAKSSSFPIYPTGPKFRGHGARPARDKIAGMSRRARAAIERLQPYHRRKRPELRLLWMLEELSNIDKHRLVHLTGAVPRTVRFTLSGPGFLRLTGIETVPGPIEEKAVIGRFYGKFDLEAGVDVKAHIAPDVIFDKRSEARSVRKWSVMQVLLGIREVIVQRVMPEIEPELWRLFPGWAWEAREASSDVIGTDEVWSSVVRHDDNDPSASASTENDQV